MSTLTAAPVETAAPMASGMMAQELWQRYHQQNTETNAATENALVQKYLPLVSAVMGRLAMTLPEHVDHDDLYSVGLIGLLQRCAITIPPAAPLLKPTRASGCAARCWTNCAAWTGCRAPSTRRRGG